MHANNEIGNLNNIELIGEVCKSRGALFHSDTVQTMGHYRHDLSKLKTHFIAASAHKFHGPKGVGFIYCRDGVQLSQAYYMAARRNVSNGPVPKIYMALLAWQKR
jgi:cysteine desulfurase